MKLFRRFSSSSNNGGYLIIKNRIKVSEINIKRNLKNAINLTLIILFYSFVSDVHPEDFGTVPKLSHGLDRVLFNPGVHFLRDPRTNVYNYDPFLRNICQPDEFNFDSVPKFVPPSQDTSLHTAATKYSSKFVSSTSSIAPSMSHFYFLISRLKPMNLSSRFTGPFEDEPQTFTQLCRSPVGVHLRPHRLLKDTSIRSLVTEKASKEEPNILMQLGNVMEKLLTNTKGDFERMLKGASDPFIPKSEETFNYLQVKLTKISNFKFYIFVDFKFLVKVTIGLPRSSSTQQIF